MHLAKSEEGDTADVCKPILVDTYGGGLANHLDEKKPRSGCLRGSYGLLTCIENGLYMTAFWQASFF